MSDLEGVLLSDYLLLQCISKGGVADIYRAQQQSEGRHEVAVKVFRPGYAGQRAFREYFMAEAQKIGELNHANILPLLEFGEGEGLLYTVTPFIRGGNLEQLLAHLGGKLSAMQSLPIIEQLCSAQHYAHERGLVHGNLKPSNVLVSSEGRILLADFAIAQGYNDSQQSLTRIGWGSAEYVAPEQSLGIMRAASDIYSLGVLLFRMLAGRPPFLGQTPVEVLLKHVRQTPPSVRTFTPSISNAVDEVLQKALQKRADDRYPSVMALYQALAMAVAIAPVASPVTPPAPTWREQEADPQTPVPPTLMGWMAEPPATETAGAGNASSGRASGGLAAGRESPLSWPEHAPEWSPVPTEQTAHAGEIPLTVSAYLEAMDKDTPATPPPPLVSVATPQAEAPLLSSRAGPGETPSAQGGSRGWKRWLPVIVVLLLLSGLLAALLSPLLFPESTPGSNGPRPSFSAGAARVGDLQQGGSAGPQPAALAWLALNH